MSDRAVAHRAMTHRPADVSPREAVVAAKAQPVGQEIEPNPVRVLPPLEGRNGSAWGLAAGDIVRLALAGLVVRKLWSTVTMVGMVLGVGGVLVIGAVGGSQEQALAAQLSRLGSNLVVISPGAASGAGASLRATDIQAIQESVPHVVALSPEMTGDEPVSFGRQSRSIGVVAVRSDIRAIQSYSVRLGVFFTDQQESNGDAVAVVGQTVVANLFGGMDPIGEQIRVRNAIFTVIGVLARKGHEQGRDLDDVIIIPFVTGQRRLYGSASLSAILLRVDQPANIPEVINAVKNTLRQEHRLTPGTADDFAVGSNQGLIGSAREQSGFMNRILAALTAAALAMGGFGVMNVMTMAVTDRTREIGIRMAVGATPENVLLQFLAEALVLTLIGGLAGIFAGYGAAAIIPRVVSSLAGYPALPKPATVALAAGVSIMVGILFGSYPAYRAQRLVPIEALRHE